MVTSHGSSPVSLSPTPLPSSPIYPVPLPLSLTHPLVSTSFLRLSSVIQLSSCVRQIMFKLLYFLSILFLFLSHLRFLLNSFFLPLAFSFPYVGKKRKKGEARMRKGGKPKRKSGSEAEKNMDGGTEGKVTLTLMTLSSPVAPSPLLTALLILNSSLRHR